MRRLILLGLTLATLATHSVARADSKSVHCNPCKPVHTVTTLELTVKKHHPHNDTVSCNTAAPYMITLSQYQDWDTPYPTYYTDYLSDFQWWTIEFNLCPGLFVPENDPLQ